MRVIRMFTTSVAASLLLGAVAHAADAPNGGDGSARKSAAVNGTSLPWNFETFQRVAPVRVQHYAESDWTSRIGMGTAAVPERGVEGFKGGSLEKAHYPEPQWSSLIGTGMAAVVKR
jgi:hypothetical protein